MGHTTIFVLLIHLFLLNFENLDFFSYSAKFLPRFWNIEKCEIEKSMNK